MTEDGIRTRRNFPAETWAVVRDAYLGGETAESIGRRLNDLLPGNWITGR